MNVAQGRPLCQADRLAAAERIVAGRPHWSDRAIAVVAGLSAKKVSEIRLRAGPSQCERRVGLDGRARPLNTAQGASSPGNCSRPIPGLAAHHRPASRDLPGDRRQRTGPAAARRGPVPPRQRGLAAAGGGPLEGASGTRDGEERAWGQVARRTIHDLRRAEAGPVAAPEQVGRSILRMLDACSLIARDRRRIIANLPPHCTAQMAELMSGYSGLWQMFADELRDCEERESNAVREVEAGRGW
ncbi:hypothetical protein NKH18_02215 [Streptomyces sp. M10(2022)]